MQYESGVTILYAASNGSLLIAELKRVYQQTDDTLEQIEWPEGGIGHFISSDDLLNELRQHRIQLDPSSPDSANQEIDFFLQLREQILQWLLDASVLKDIHKVWHEIDAVADLTSALDAAFTQAILGGVFHSIGGLSEWQEVAFLSASYRENTSLSRARSASVDLDEDFNDWEAKNEEFLKSLLEGEIGILQGDRWSPNIQDSKTWYLSKVSLYQF